MLFSILIILLLYSLIDLFVFHEVDLTKTIFTFNFHEFWRYFIVFFFFAYIYVFGYFIIKKQVVLDRVIKKSEQSYLRLIKGANDLFSSIQDGVIVLDKEFNIVHINPTTQKLYSYKKQIIGKKCFQIYSNRETPCLKCPNLSLFREKQITSKIHPKYDEQGNEIGWLEIFCLPLFNQDTSHLVGITNYCKDITEKVKAEQLIIEENKQLTELNQFRKALITRVSHELKTPLNSIQSASQHVLTNYHDYIDPRIIRFIEIIHKGGLRLTALVENILDTSMIESGRLVLNKEKINFSETVQECIDQIINLASNRNLTLNSDLPNTLYFEYDRIRMEQVILNLLSNAIKNTPPQGEIYINVLKINNHIELKIRDTGIGLTEAEFQKLFTPFGKIERYGQNLHVDIEGTGIGLYLSKELVELHGGQILVDSQGRNKGSTFTVRLFQ